MYLNLINIYHKNKQQVKGFLLVFCFILLFILIFFTSNPIFAGDFFLGLGITSVTTLDLSFESSIANIMEVVSSDILYTGCLFPLKNQDNFLGVKLSFFSSAIFLVNNFYLQIFYLGMEGFYYHTIFKSGIFSVNFNSGLWLGVQIVPFLRSRDDHDFIQKVTYDSLFPINTGYTLGMNLKIGSFSICVDYYLSFIDVLKNEQNDYKIFNMVVISLTVFI